MPTFLSTRSLYYNDVNLIAQPQSLIQSREQIPIALDRVYVAPMAAIVGEKFALEAYRLGLGICLHRFAGLDEQIRILHKLYDEFGREQIQARNVWVSVGLNEMDSVKKLNHPNVLIDVANAYLSSVVSFFNLLRAQNYKTMVGNVHTSQGLNLYLESQVRVGIANGRACDSASMTGYNRGQVTEILDCAKHNYGNNEIIADGGINSPGDAAKAFGLGAHYVMLGGYFALSEEAENVQNGEYRYWGGASHRQQIKTHGKIRRHSEGKDLELNKKDIKPLAELTKELWGGISSAISYSGYDSLDAFRRNGVFEEKK